MSSWLFEILDTARDVTSVIGDGDTVADADVDARAKWDALMSSRSDYADRIPIIGSTATRLSTEATATPPTLIL